MFVYFQKLIFLCTRNEFSTVRVYFAFTNAIFDAWRMSLDALMLQNT